MFSCGYHLYFIALGLYMANLSLLTAILLNHLIYSQIEKQDIACGEITLVTDYIMKFKNLSRKENRELYKGMIKTAEETEVAADGNLTPSAKSKIYKPYYLEGIYVTAEKYRKRRRQQ